MAKQRLVDADDARDRGKILVLVIRELAFAVERRVDDEGPGLRQEQRIAVGRRLGHGLSSDDMGGAALVLDDDLLAPAFRKPLPDGARHHIRHAAGRRRHRDGDRPARIGLRIRSAWIAGACQQHQRKPFHDHRIALSA
jgi:hypothetical protein